jgi:hypothetical protein
VKAPPCEAYDRDHVLTCTLEVSHVMHHDPAGLWWGPCTLLTPGHCHGKENSRGVLVELPEVEPELEGG